MAALIPLAPGEQLLKEGYATHLRSTVTSMGYNLARGTARVTTHRFLMDPQLEMNAGPVKISFGPVAYPLSHITATGVAPMKVQWSTRDVLRLDFDNGGKEFLFFDDDPRAWEAAIVAAKATAPVLDYTVMPSLKSGVEKPRPWTVVAAVVGGIFSCAMVACVVILVVGQFL